MMGQQGMNIGGISALFNSILIDYSVNKVGFKSPFGKWRWGIPLGLSF
jgi:hypothetical protein